MAESEGLVIDMVVNIGAVLTLVVVEEIGGESGYLLDTVGRLVVELGVGFEPVGVGWPLVDEDEAEEAREGQVDGLDEGGRVDDSDFEVFQLVSHLRRVGTHHLFDLVLPGVDGLQLDDLLQLLVGVSH